MTKFHLKSSPGKNSIKRKSSLKSINQIIVNSLEEVLTATKQYSRQNDEPFENEPTEKSELTVLNEMISKELLGNTEEVTSLSITRINVSAQSSNTETVSQYTERIEPTEKKSKEYDGYIRLTEDEINDIINTTVPIKIDHPEEPVKANTSLENSITCTSF